LFSVSQRKKHINEKEFIAVAHALDYFDREYSLSGLFDNTHNASFYSSKIYEIMTEHISFYGATGFLCLFLFFVF
jgi:hypothetical protein